MPRCLGELTVLPMIEADLFAAYLKVAQDRMRELFIHGPLENEQIVDSRLLHPDYSQSTQAESWREPPIPAEDDARAKIRCTLIASKEDGEQRYRAIVSREGYADGVCINCMYFPTTFNLCTSKLTE